MKLHGYLRDKRESVAAFARRINEADTTIRKIVYGQRQPSMPLAAKIIAATDGDVTASDLVLTASDQPSAG